MLAVNGFEIGPEICGALGLPSDRVISIDLRIHANEIVTATVEFATDRDQLTQVASILKRYQLHEKAPENP